MITVEGGLLFDRCSWPIIQPLLTVRNVLAHIPKGSKSMVAAFLRTIFAQPNRAAATQQLRTVAAAMGSRWPQAAEVVAAADEDVLAYMSFPVEHWTRIYSTNPLERLNEEAKRRTNVVGVFPDHGSVLRLVRSILMEVWDDWQIGRRYFSQESMAKLTNPEALLVVEPQPLTLAPVK